MAVVLDFDGARRARITIPDRCAPRRDRDAMSRPDPLSRRAFLGQAAVAAAIVPAAGAVTATVTGCGSGNDSTSASRVSRAARRGPVAENMLDGDPHWQLRHT